MVKVDCQTTDQIVAWRVRDALAAHPLLGGATAQIHIIGGYDEIILEGWAADEQVIHLATQLTRRAAGRRTVAPRLKLNRKSINR